MTRPSLPLFIFAAIVIAVSAFTRSGYSVARTSASALKATEELDDVTRERISSLIEKNKILLFMKGNKVFPQCGFSNTACRILDTLNVPYDTVDVLADPEIRAGIKVFSSWPTIPQLYINGEFVGGSDIMLDMYKSGDLAEMCEVAAAN